MQNATHGTDKRARRRCLFLVEGAWSVNVTHTRNLRVTGAGAPSIARLPSPKEGKIPPSRLALLSFPLLFLSSVIESPLFPPMSQRRENARRRELCKSQRTCIARLPCPAPGKSFCSKCRPAPGQCFFCFLSRGARALPQLFIVSGRSRHLSPPPMANGFFHLASDRAIARLSHDPLSSLPSTLPSSPLLPPSPAHRSPAFPPSPSFFLRRPTCCPAPGQRFRDLFRNVVRPPGKPNATALTG